MPDFLNEALITAVIALLGGIGGFLKSFAFVREGSRGVKVRFGKVVRNRDGTPKIIEPGFVLMVPWVESLLRRHVRQQTVRCDNQMIKLSDNSVFLVSAVILFRVTDVYRALFEIDELDSSLEDYCMSVLRDVVSDRTVDNIGDTDEISELLLSRVREKAEEWGVAFAQFKLTNCSPTEETARMIITKSTAKIRMESIKEAAELLNVRVEEFDPSLASVLVGTPMVASVGSTRNVTLVTRSTNGKVEEHSD